MNKFLRIFFEPDTGAGGTGGTGGGSPSLLGGDAGAGSGAGAGGAAGPGSAATGALLKENGEFSDGWLDRLPEDFKDSHQILGQFKDINGVLKSLVNQQRLIGKKGDFVQPLTDKSTPEEIADFRKKMGIPDTVDKYPAKYEGLGIPEETLKEFNGLAHKLNLTPSQVSEVVKYYGGIEVKTAEAGAKAKQADLERMQKTLADAWGSGEDFRKNQTQVERMALSTGLPLDTNQWTPEKVCLALQRAAAMVSDDRLVASDSTPTMQTGQAKANAIMMDTTNPLHAKWCDGDGATIKLVTDLLANARK